MTEDAADTVPGMADAIEARRRELGLTPGEMADAAGITRQGLTPVRRGLRRNYQEKLKTGVATALQWPSDAIDRLLAGEAPSDWPEPDTKDVDFAQLIRTGFANQVKKAVDVAKAISWAQATAPPRRPSGGGGAGHESPGQSGEGGI